MPTPLPDPLTIAPLPGPFDVTFPDFFDYLDVLRRAEITLDQKTP